MDTKVYERIRLGGSGIYEQPRGLIAVWGKEAVQFLDGLVSNDVKTLADGDQMLAAFPSAQGRLLALVRVLRQGERFYFETEEATREKVFQNLFRFTFAGDFFVEDVSNNYRFADTINIERVEPGSFLQIRGPRLTSWAVAEGDWTEFYSAIREQGCDELSPDLYETLRIESGIQKYGVDMDETTIVPELGLEGLISYKKGCYIGQEIIARIHFRGHVAKSLTGLVSEPGTAANGLLAGAEIQTPEGSNAGRITSATFSPKLGRSIALAYVRYAHLAEGTELMSADRPVTVTPLPFI